MSSNSIKTTVGLMLVLIVLFSLTSHGQIRYTQSGKSQITISGTSTMHDWTMKSDKATYDAVLQTDQGNPTEMASLTVSTPAESLKSGKGAMDKNAYSALKTDKHKQITFQLTSGKIDGKMIRCQGKLTIAGTTKQIEIDATYSISQDGTIHCTGSKKLAMSDYGVEPPSFMFGSVTTGNEITVSFDVTLTPKTQQVTLN